MPSKRIAIDSNDCIYFLTFTVKRWYYIFDRYKRWNILLKPLKHCQTHKHLKIYSYVFMLNHIHLIITCPNVSGFVRDFKQYTSRELMRNLRENEPTIARLFETENGQFEIWQRTNMPKIIESYTFYLQKKNYIEMNPVRKGYVENPGHWVYSSGYDNPLIEIEVVE